MKKPNRLGWVFSCLFFVTNLSAYQKQALMMPMRDGIRLATDLYLPSTGKGPWPTVLVRTPYGRGSGMDPLMLLLMTDLKGYTLAIQDLRGRGGSEGIDSLFFSDGWGRIQDGYDAVEWTANQSWCNGKIGTWGASGLGIPQYLAAGTRPPHLKCCCVIVAASNLYEDAIFYGGVYQKALVDGWLADVKQSKLADFFIQHPNYDSRYDIVNLSTRWDSVSVPILHVSGWHDIFIQGIINAFVGIQEHGGPEARGRQKMIIGPWVHDITTASTGELTYPNSSYTQFIELQVDWFDRWLKDIDNGVNRIPPVQYYTMGATESKTAPGNRWISRNNWPPPSRDLPLYLASGKRLMVQKPGSSESYGRFAYDPKNPVPTLGGRNLNIKAGSYDQRFTESRPDVLVYSTGPLSDSLTFAGRVTVTLWASSDQIDTDFSAKLCDVYPDGRSMLIADGIIQARHRNSLTNEEFLQVNQAYEFTIDLWSTAVTLAAGHAIQLDISSSNSPRFETNFNTGEPLRKSTDIRIANQTIYHDIFHASALHLPVVDGTISAVQLADAGRPKTFLLGRNYPNPFNSETWIPIILPESVGSASGSKLTLEICDMLGRPVRQWTLERSSEKRRLLRWRGDDWNGHAVPSGIYLCRLIRGAEIQTQKITLLR